MAAECIDSREEFTPKQEHATSLASMMVNLKSMGTAILSCFIMLLMLDYCSCQSRNDSIRLMKDMLRGYHRKHRPVLDQSRPVRVNATFSVISLNDFDEVGELFSLVLSMNLTWVDEVINWEPASYGGITSQLYDVDDVWYPQLVIGTTTEQFQELADDWMKLRVYSTGHVVFALGVLVKSSCGIDVTFYPFDTQKCRVIFGPWISLPEELTLNTPTPFLGDTFYIENSEWKIVSNGTRTTAYNMIYLEFELERKPLFAMVNTIVPMMIMSVLNLMVFVLPAESGERVSFTITVLLSSAVFLTLVANSLPASSDPMSILAFFLMVSLLLSALICITTILNLRVFHKNSCEPISAWQRRLVRVCCKGKTKQAYQTDKTSSQDTLPTTDDEEEEEISCQNVASAIDKILFIGFSAAFVLNIICFTILSSVNKDIQGVETIGD